MARAVSTKTTPSEGSADPEALLAASLPRTSNNLMFGCLLGATGILALFAGAISGYAGNDLRELLSTRSDKETADKTEMPKPDVMPEPTVAYVELPLGVYQIATTHRENFLSAKVILEVPTEHVGKVEQLVPTLEETIGSYMRILTPEAVRGPLGLYELNEALLHRVRFHAGSEAVKRVLLTDLLIG